MTSKYLLCLKRVLTFFLISFLWSFQVHSQGYKVIKINALMDLMSTKNDSALLVNFWATWCKPCVSELPHFEAFRKKYAAKGIQVILVSLDDVKNANARIARVVKEKLILSPIYLLNEPDYNAWINKIDSSWSGSLPATLFLDKKKNKIGFYEKELSQEELENIVKPFIQ